MLLVDRQTVPAARDDGSHVRLKLRVRDDGQIVELADGKMTIGSSPRCNLRLDRPGVEPLHCLVVDGPEGLRVRRWAADTRLNGTPVEDALLEAGDCLSLGGVELELVGPAGSVTPTAAATSIFESHLETADELASPELLLLEWHRDEPTADELKAAVAAPVNLAETTDFIPVDVPSDDVHQEPAIEEKSCCEAAVLDTANEELSANATVGDEPREPTFLDEMDAAELVFRELQAACLVARGRNRKMLSALRNLRDEKDSLAQRFENGDRSDEFAQERAAWEASRRQAEEDQRELHLELKELRQQLSEWEGRLAEHTERMAELQQELVASRASGPAVNLNSVAAEVQPYIEPAIRVDEQPLLLLAAERDAHLDEARQRSHSDPTGYEAVVPAAPSLPIDVELENVQPAAFVEPVAYAATPAVDAASSDAPAAWESPSERKLEWSTPGVPAHREEIAEVGQSWDGHAAAERSSDVDPFDFNTNVEAEPTEKIAWEASDRTSAESGSSEDGEDDISPFAEFSIWNQGAALEEASSEETVTTPPEVEPSVGSPFTWDSSSSQRFDDNANSEASQSDQQADLTDEPNPWAIGKKEPEVLANEQATEAEPPTAGVQSNSFIDRYSHLFAEEAEAAPIDKVEPPIAKAVQALSSPVAGMTPPSPMNASGSGDEESIEQYMAKLMKRVRGEDPIAAALPTAPVAAPASGQSQVPLAPSTVQEEAEQKAAADSTSEAGDAQEDHSEVAVNWDAFTRRAATAPTTDLGALRAIANESARGDISRHRLRTHRRDAKTKVIVSVLAGMTSLWLMLEAPNWRDIQFITACVSLIVAAYWAGEAMREMVRSMRVGHDGHGVDSAEDAALPIDVR